MMEEKSAERVRRTVRHSQRAKIAAAAAAVSTAAAAVAAYLM